MKRFVILAALLLVLPASALAQGFAKVGTYGAQFLKIGTSARATGMGSAFTGVADDASSVFWNPGGLVDVVTNEVLLSHTEWPADINLTTAVLAFNPRSIPGTIAISARSLWLDPMLVRTAYNPEGTGQHFDAGSTSFGFSYGRFFTDKFSAGVTLNYLHLGLAETAVNSASFDFGIMYRIGIRDLKLGMVIQHLGGKITFDEREARLPTMFKVGASFNLLRTENQRLLFAGEFQHPSDNLERANVGAEYSLNDLFFGRVGYNIEYDTDGLAFGFGAALRTGETSRIQADYSAVDMGPLQYVHRFSVSVVY
ncbi:MAG: PorV/PorQ family protein [Candidatus Krumholzibacteriia bacterium]